MISKPQSEAAPGGSGSSRNEPQWNGGREASQRELMRRIVFSPTFARSERLSSLLTYVCDMTLKGRAAEINEQKIGQHVFGRSQNYDSTIDGIVRTQASRLRQRLDRYFEQEGAEEPVRIVIPRGGYVPVFEPRTASAEAPPTAEPPAPQAAAAQTVPAHSRQGLPWALCAVLGMALVFLAAREYVQLRSVRDQVMPKHPLWSNVFLRDRPTLIAAADSGLVMFHNMSAQTLELDDYLQGDYRKPPPASVVFGPATPEKIWLANLANRRYTSFVDLEIIVSLQQRAQALQSKLQVRYTRDLRPNDLKSGNAILLGASEANPWMELFERNMNFVFRNDYKTNVFSVINRSPRDGEPGRWDSAPPDPLHRVYGLVAWVPNLSGDGSVLILEGTSMSGTEGAWDFVSDDSRLLPFLKRIERPDGTIPHFEVLLGTQNMNASAVRSTVLAWRTSN